MPWSVAIDPIAIAGGIFILFRIFRRFDRSLSEFKEDWKGTPERPGIPARPGVMERLSMIEIYQANMHRDLEKVTRKVFSRNEGGE